ncbi:hypothetical protein IscW_ISCW018033, partial [Ixodes scapularis]
SRGCLYYLPELVSLTARIATSNRTTRRLQRLNVLVTLGPLLIHGRTHNGNPSFSTSAMCMLVKVALAGPQWHVLAPLSRSMEATRCPACKCAQDTKYTSWRHVPGTIASL